MRKFLAKAGLVLLAAVMSATAIAETFPDRPLKLIVGIGAGSVTDAVGRLVAQHLSTKLGQPIVVENRPGAGGTIAAEAVARSPADGYTLLLASSSLPIFPHMYTLRFDPIKDLTAVGQFAGGGMVLLASADGPYTKVTDIIARAKTGANAVTYASAGSGSNSHLAAEVFGQMAGVKFVHVPYKAATASYPDLQAGRVDFVFDGVTAALQQTNAGKMRALAVTTPDRMNFMPAVPTMSEAGVPGFSQPVWVGFFAPAGVPKPIMDQLSATMFEVVSQPAFQKEELNFGIEPFAATGEQLNERVRRETREWGTKLQDLHLQLRGQP